MTSGSSAPDLYADLPRFCGLILTNPPQCICKGGTKFYEISNKQQHATCFCSDNINGIHKFCNIENIMFVSHRQDRFLH